MYQLIQYIANKNQSGYISPDDFNLIINQGQLLYLDFLLGPPEQYQPGRAIPKVSISMTSEVREILAAFLDPFSALAVDNTGLALYPAGFQRVDAIITDSVPPQRVKFVHQDFLYSTLKSTIDPVVTNPIYTIDSAGFRVFPNLAYNNVAAPSIKISFVKTPARIVWAFTSVGGIPVYDPGPSVDPEWYDLDCFEVIARALRMVGVNLQSAAISQYAEEIKNGGQ